MTALDALATAVASDIIYVCDDPGGTPLSKKVTFTVVAALMETTINLSNAAVGTLPIGRGGTGATSFTSSRVPFYNGTVLTSSVIRESTGLIGIGITPTVELHVAGDGNLLKLDSTSATTQAEIRSTATSATTNTAALTFNVKRDDAVDRDAAAIVGRLSTITSGTEQSRIDIQGFKAGTFRSFLTCVNGNWVFGEDGTVNSSFRLFVDGATLLNNGDVCVGTTTLPSANNGKVIVLGDNAAKPTMGSNTAGLYGKDVAGTVEVFAVDEAGNETQLSSHYPVHLAKEAGINIHPDDPYPTVSYCRNDSIGYERLSYVNPFTGITQVVNKRVLPV